MNVAEKNAVTLVVKTFAEHLQQRMEWLDKLKKDRSDLNAEIKDTEKAIREAVDKAADAQVELPIAGSPR